MNYCLAKMWLASAASWIEEWEVLILGRLERVFFCWASWWQFEWAHTTQKVLVVETLWSHAFHGGSRSCFGSRKFSLDSPGMTDLADVADRLRSLHSWLYEPRLVTRTLARLAASQASTALQVLNYMQSQKIESNAFHYTAVIAGCARSGSWRVVGSLLQQMVEQSNSTGLSDI